MTQVGHLLCVARGCCHLLSLVHATADRRASIRVERKGCVGKSTRLAQRAIVAGPAGHLTHERYDATTADVHRHTAGVPFEHAEDTSCPHGRRRVHVHNASAGHRYAEELLVG